MHPALVALLTQTVTQVPYTGQDAYGKPQYGPPVTRACRIQAQVNTVLVGGGQERRSQTVVYLNGDVPVNMRDRFTLEDGTQPTLQQVDSFPDPFVPGVVDHYKCYL